MLERETRAPRGASLGPCVALLLGTLGLGVLGCNFQIPAPTYIHQTKLISVRAEVVELGPLNPDRVGPPFESAIAEPMPGDRLAFEAVVVDASGHRLAADELDSLWFQCGVHDCGARGLTFDLPDFDRPCEDIDELTLDEACRLAHGDRSTSFEVSPLGQEVVDVRVASFYGVVAWGDRSAEDCWADRRAAESELVDCAFIQRQVKVGPSWWLLAYAETLGLVSPIPVYQIPVAVYGQVANRIPKISVEVFVDGASAGVYPEREQFTAQVGSSITLEVEFDPLEQLTQTYFYASLDNESETYWFQPAQEFITDAVYTTHSIHIVGDDEFPTRRDFVVDEYAEPGSAQIFLVYWDDRFGEGVARLDFEVKG
jgi:hypothetical protein